jgi:hypothetical protein
MTPEQRAERLVVEDGVTYNVGSKHEHPRKAYDLILAAIREAEASAVLRERERCAAIADEADTPDCGEPGVQLIRTEACRDIAAAIRNPL